MGLQGHLGQPSDAKGLPQFFYFVSCYFCPSTGLVWDGSLFARCKPGLDAWASWLPICCYYWSRSSLLLSMRKPYKQGGKIVWEVWTLYTPPVSDHPWSVSLLIIPAPDFVLFSCKHHFLIESHQFFWSEAWGFRNGQPPAFLPSVSSCGQWRPYPTLK